MPDDDLAVLVLDLTFDSGALGALRAGVMDCACQAGLSQDRAEDMLLAVHELAANAVRHGAGSGRLRVWKRAWALDCQVQDGDPAAASAQAAASSLPVRPGHGLWVAWQLADRMQILAGAGGTRAMVTFNLRGQGYLGVQRWPELGEREDDRA